MPCRQLKVQYIIDCHNVHTKFGEYRSIGSEVATGTYGCTHRQHSEAYFSLFFFCAKEIVLKIIPIFYQFFPYHTRDK